MNDGLPNFSHYLKANDSLTFDLMQRIHEAIVFNAKMDDQDFYEIWNDLIKASIKYSSTRANWYFLNNSQKIEKDSGRTVEHDVIINNFLILERIFKMKSWDCSFWTQKLFLQNTTSTRTKESVSEHRKRIGDFANYLAFIYALNNR